MRRAFKAGSSRLCPSCSRGGCGGTGGFGSGTSRDTSKNPADRAIDRTTTEFSSERGCQSDNGWRSTPLRFICRAKGNSSGNWAGVVQAGWCESYEACPRRRTYPGTAHHRPILGWYWRLARLKLRSRPVGRTRTLAFVAAGTEVAGRPSLAGPGCLRLQHGCHSLGKW